MSFYHRLGSLPSKKHTTFYQEDESLYREELFSTQGFSGIYSNRYHRHMPTQILAMEEIKVKKPTLWEQAPLEWALFHTDQCEKKGNWLESRQLWLSNADCSISTAKIDRSGDLIYKNAFAHELLFVHRGRGKFRSDFGELDFSAGDYLVIPKGCIYTLDVDVSMESKMLIIESKHPFEIPKKFRNEYGQLEEHAPYCERDFRAPEKLCMEKGSEVEVVCKAGDRFYKHRYQHHPFDVVGWDGFEYPFAFSIKDFSPVVGKIHLPPPVHQVFHAGQFVVCNFVPRLFDFHPKAIPAPYFHSNVDSDEVIYYVEGDFMSRRGIEEGSISYHPMGLPHGPQPGKTEASIGKKETFEYAVMIDTFGPLQRTTDVKKISDLSYPTSWIHND
ncbi:MAG: homogentisate 1,2-dioxygenase [Bdellovibrionota bacterium]